LSAGVSTTTAVDFHRTPPFAVRAILPHLGVPALALDLGCGDGAIGTELRLAWGEGADIWGAESFTSLINDARGAHVDLDEYTYKIPVYDSVIGGDALVLTDEYFPGGPPDLIISNPPFTRAREFAERAFDLVRPGGLVAFLLRLNWMAGQERAAWHRAAPSDVYVLPRRPSFRADGRSDATEYGWFLWRPHLRTHGGHWSVLDCEPFERRPRGER